MYFVAAALLIAGIALLIKGADWLVEGGSTIARKFGVTELTIGLTIVAFGTSLPELTVNLFSSFSGANDIAIGNVVGSNIANILLIIGVASILSPIAIQTSTAWKELPFSLLATVVLWLMANDAIVDGLDVSILSRSDGLTLMAYFIIFLWYSFGMRRAENDGEHQEESEGSLLAFGKIVTGIALLVLGGKMAVEGATSIAEAFGVSQALIGLSVVAIGTSLPELATSIVAALKKKADLAVGNIVGSNIFNIFWILGASASIRPLVFSPNLNLDLTVVVLATILLFVVIHSGSIHRRILFFWAQKQGHVINRREGIVLLASYCAYIGFIAWRG